ncbi:hypothetical protein ABH966_003568 [Lysinibacillus sp. RC46]|uniref:hypothetical protein n=1 Tax=Lysinibacillus sp. RC46 TaxID=3156295 RepID=UPI0035117C74
MKKLFYVGALSTLLLAACGEETTTITPNEFKKLENGMSPDEVKEIVGGLSKNPDAKEDDDLYLFLDYDGENGVEKESSVSLVFKDGKLSVITENGLMEKKVETAPEHKEETPVAVTWQDKVKEIVTKEGTPTEKYDAVMVYAKEYPSTEAEIKEFEEYIIAEYKNKKYVADINNAEYMLSNVFRANVINRFYGQVDTPINKFAFDFYQNTKYTYRGEDTLDSSAVRSNERQMDKALKQMEK